MKHEATPENLFNPGMIEFSNSNGSEGTERIFASGTFLAECHGWMAFTTTPRSSPRTVKGIKGEESS